MIKVTPLEIFEKLILHAILHPNHRNIDPIGVLINRLPKDSRDILKALTSDMTSNMRPAGLWVINLMPTWMLIFKS